MLLGGFFGATDEIVYFRIKKKDVQGTGFGTGRVILMRSEIDETEPSLTVMQPPADFSFKYFTLRKDLAGRTR